MNDGFHLEIKLEVEMVLEMVQEKIWTNWAARHITARNKADKPGQSLNLIFVRNFFHALDTVVFGNMEQKTVLYRPKSLTSLLIFPVFADIRICPRLPCQLAAVFLAAFKVVKIYRKKSSLCTSALWWIYTTYMQNICENANMVTNTCLLMSYSWLITPFPTSLI